MEFKGLENIEVVLQTVFAARFSEARPRTIERDVVLMGDAPCLPVALMMKAPVFLICANEAEIIAVPPLVGVLSSLAPTIRMTARDLAIAEAWVRREALGTERATFFFAS